MGPRLGYLGHSAFHLTSSEGVRVLIDPYGNPERPGDPWFEREAPVVEPDVVLVTHAHFDHSALHRVAGSPVVVSAAGERRVGDVTIRGFDDRHVPGHGIDDNVVFVVETGGIRFCHFGDNRAEIPEQLSRALHAPDLFAVPIDDSSHLLAFDEADGVIERVAPRVVVPVHHAVAGITDERAPLATTERWLDRQPRVRRLEAREIELTPERMPREREVWSLAEGARRW